MNTHKRAIEVGLPKEIAPRATVGTLAFLDSHLNGIDFTFGFTAVLMTQWTYSVQTRQRITLSISVSRAQYQHYGVYQELPYLAIVADQPSR